MPAQVLRGQQIFTFRALALRSALRMEIHGMKRRGQSAYSIIKAEYGFKGNKQKVYDQMTKLLTEKGVLK